MELPDTPTGRRLGNIITRWTYAYAGGSTSGYRYFGTCSTPGCGKEISLYKYDKRQKGNLRCRLHSKYRGSIFGVAIYSQRLWRVRKSIIAIKTENNVVRAYVACKKRGCKDPVLFRHNKYRHKNRPEQGYCRKHMSKRRRLRPFEANYNLFLRAAEKRAIPCRLTFKQYTALCKETSCSYCNAAVSRGEFSVAGKSNYASFLDRVDPRKGYTADNCVPCCKPCNFAKNVYLSADEMAVVGALRAKDRKKAKKLVLDYDLDKNAATAQSIFDYVWAARKGRSSQWKRRNWILQTATPRKSC